MHLRKVTLYEVGGKRLFVKYKAIFIQKIPNFSQARDCFNQ